MIYLYYALALLALVAAAVALLCIIAAFLHLYYLLAPLAQTLRDLRRPRNTPLYRGELPWR